MLPPTAEKGRPPKRPAKEGTSAAGASPAGRLLALSAGCLTALLVLELALALLDPFHLRVRGDRIVLHPHLTRVITNDQGIRGIDDEIVHRRNSLGFRGPEPPPRFDAATTVVAVGGSTTECYYLSDGKTWTARLAAHLRPQHPRLWVNNAGFDGHSTFGHLVLLEEYVLPMRPDLVLLLVGANDVGLETPTGYDARFRAPPASAGTSNARGGLRPLVTRLARDSHLFALADAALRALEAERRGLVHQGVQHWRVTLEPRYREVPAEELERSLAALRPVAEAGFRPRLEAIVHACRRRGVEPVLLTQPMLFGDAVDPQSGVDLARLAWGEHNGVFHWRRLEVYNDVTRAVARRASVPLVDLAAELPKDSRYFYDAYHFTNAGAEAVARVVAPRLDALLDAAPGQRSTAQSDSTVSVSAGSSSSR